ncbi:MAG TPA: M48 family metalloprotease, partial [Phycisphaerae bacterium]|nr:M48 family metalloprotease [Phycisphaerae bacterium]
AGLPVYLLIAGAMAGRLIQFGVSRERLFLADAEAARMTRYPEALVGALEKMDADTTPLLSASAATAHLFTVSPVMAGGGRLSGVWSSHPTTEERVERLRSIGGVEA